MNAIKSTRVASKKPDLQTPVRAGWSAQLKQPAVGVVQQLVRQLDRTKHSTAEKDAFLRFCLRHAALAAVDRSLVSDGDMRKMLDEVTLNARKLLAVLRPWPATSRGEAQDRHAELIEGIELAADHSRYSKSAPIKWSKAVHAAVEATPEKGLVSAAWDLVDALAATSALASSQIEPDRGRRQADELGKGLINCLAVNYRSRFGELPPHTAREWFAVFIGLLGRSVKANCGPKPVAKCLEELAQASQSSNSD